MENKGSFFGKLFLFLLILGIILVIALFGTKIYLFFQMILGNDLTIRLSTNNESLFMNKGETEKVEFTTSAIMNPFCKAYCQSDFVDLSSGQVIDNDSFELTLTSSLTKSYPININKLGKGQDLYNFQIICQSKKSFLCQTTEDKKFRNILLTVDYDLNDSDKGFISDMQNNISYMNQKISDNVLFINDTNKFSKEYSNIKEFNIGRKTNTVSNSLLSFNNTLNLSKAFLDNNEYEKLNLNDLINNFNDVEEQFNDINASFYNNLTQFQNIISNLTYIESTLNNYNKQNVSLNSSNQIKFIENDYNELATNLNSRSNLSISTMQSKVNSLNLELVNLDNLIKNEPGEGFLVSLDLINITNPIFQTRQNNPITFNFNQIQPVCCLNNICKPCCNGPTCQSNESLYPIVLVHGHDFSKSTTAEYALDSFGQIQNKLASDGYISAGELLLNTNDPKTNGIFGKMNYPINIITSYYFDIYKTSGKGTIIQTKTDNLDSYAIRLRDIVNTVKEKTGKDKVIIVAHSMGGLVTRRYIQVFGSNDVDKIILIGTPNNGVNGTTLRYCSILGSSPECNDMDSGSVFINKLNRNNESSVPIYNIIGIGCDTDGEDGDGIVTRSSAYLSYTENYYISGTCDSSFYYLHSDLIKVDKYSKVYDLIKEILKTK
ncbi:MAG: alpha/beta fold hydrolase [Nanoarchaeota archaeon]